MLLKKKFILGLTMTSQLFATTQARAAAAFDADLIPRNVASAESGETTGVVDEKTEITPEHAQSLNHVGNILSDKFFLSSMLELQKNVTSQWSNIKEKVTSRVETELNRYKFSLSIGLKDKGFTLGTVGFAADTYYQMVVEPSYKTGKQMRQDIYVVGLRGSQTISAGSQIRITFFREFDSKTDAIFDAHPYGLNRIPMTADDLALLKNQDGVRLEVLGNLSIGHGIAKLAGTSNLGASVSYGVDTLFMMDLYKHDANTIRTRFIGTVNRGTAKIEGDLVAAAHVVNWLPGKLKELFQFGIHASGQKSLRISDPFPIESQMVDYIFRFDAKPIGSESNKTAAMAYNEIMNNMRKAGFIEILNPNLKEDELAQVLLSKAKTAEELSIADQNRPYEERRVLKVFKGRMSSNLATATLGLNLSMLARTSVESGSSDTHVTSIENDQTKKYYLLMNSFTRSKNTFLFGRSETEVISDLDALVDSDVNKTAGALVDLVNRIQIRDKSLNRSDFEAIRHGLNQSIPKTIIGREKILDAIPTSDQKSSLLMYKYSMATEALAQINKFSEIEIATRLNDFVENHPDKMRMGLPTRNNDSSDFNVTQDFINGLAHEIKKSVNSDLSNQERLDTLRSLMKMPIFSRYIITEFLTTLLSSAEADRLLNLNLFVSSSEISNRKVSVGKNRVSSIYDSVMVMRSIINDRSLDLRIESVSNSNGTQGLEAVNILKFKPAE